MKGELVLGSERIDFDSTRIVSTSQGTVLFEVDEDAEIKKVETDGSDRIFVLVRGKSSASKTNVFALDRSGRTVWRAKDRPTDHDDELVDMRYQDPLLETWSWNLVYEYEGRSGALVRKEPNK